MSKFQSALTAQKREVVEPEILEVQPETAIVAIKKLGRPRGKRSNEANTQVTGYVPEQLYYDVRIKLLEINRRNRKNKKDFSDLLREWMEQWITK